MTKANKLSKKKRHLNIEDQSAIEDKLQEEYRKSMHDKIEESDNQLKREKSLLIHFY